MREHLTRAAVFDPRALEQLEGPSLDLSYAYLWLLWLQMHSGRTSNGMGVNTLTWTDMLAFNQLYDLRLMKEEIDLLRDIEGAYMQYRNEQAAPKDDEPPT